MALTVAASGTTATLVVGAVETTLATLTSSGVYQAVVDCSGMVNGDELELHLYGKRASLSDTEWQMAVYPIAGVQTVPLRVSIPIISPVSLRVSLKLTAGTNQAFTWGIWESTTPVQPESAQYTSVPAATQIVDLYGEVWTIVGNQVALNGVIDSTTSNIVQLFYFNHQVYKKNTSQVWQFWNGTAWVTSTALAESAETTAVPPASQLVDATPAFWTIMSGQVADDGVVNSSTSNVSELYYHNHTVYYKNTSSNWFLWNGTAFIATTDPTLFNLATTRPFVSTSPWNTPIPGGKTYTATGVNWSGQFISASLQIPVYVAQPTDPVCAVSVGATWGWPANPSLHIPAGATGNGPPGTDAPLVVIDGTTAYNFWQFQRSSNTTATAVAWAQADVNTGTGWGNPTNGQGAGITAAGSSELGGLPIQVYTDANPINFALNIVAGNNIVNPTKVPPAISSDGPTAGAPLSEGMLLAIPPGTAMPGGLSALGQKVFTALQTYGGYVIDIGGGSNSGIRLQSNGYNTTIQNALTTDLRVLFPLLQKVS